MMFSISNPEPATETKFSSNAATIVNRIVDLAVMLDTDGVGIINDMLNSINVDGSFKKQFVTPVQLKDSAELKKNIAIIAGVFGNGDSTTVSNDIVQEEAMLAKIATRTSATNPEELDGAIDALIANQDWLDKIGGIVNSAHPGSIKSNEDLFNYFIELMNYISAVTTDKNELFVNFTALQAENAQLKQRLIQLETQNKILVK